MPDRSTTSACISTRAARLHSCDVDSGAMCGDGRAPRGGVPVRHGGQDAVGQIQFGFAGWQEWAELDAEAEAASRQG